MKATERSPIENGMHEDIVLELSGRETTTNCQNMCFLI